MSCSFQFLSFPFTSPSLSTPTSHVLWKDFVPLFFIITHAVHVCCEAPWLPVSRYHCASLMSISQMLCCIFLKKYFLKLWSPHQITLFVLQFDPNGWKCLSMDGYTDIGRTVHSQANNTVAGAFWSSKREDATSHTQITVFMQRLTVCWIFYSYYYVIPLHITLRMRLFLWKLLEPSGSTIKTWFHFSRNTIRRYCIQNSFLIYDSYAHILLKLRHARMETTSSFNMN